MHHGLRRHLHGGSRVRRHPEVAESVHRERRRSSQGSYAGGRGPAWGQCREETNEDRWPGSTARIAGRISLPVNFLLIDRSTPLQAHKARRPSPGLLMRTRDSTDGPSLALRSRSRQPCGDPRAGTRGTEATPDPLVFHVALPAAHLDSCRLDTQSACAAEDETVIAKEVVRRGPPFVAERKTCRPFNLVVAFERTTDNDGNLLGRGVAESSLHHFAVTTGTRHEELPPSSQNLKAPA